MINPADYILWQNVFKNGGGAGGGDFFGPSSSVAGNILTFSNTTGKRGKDSGVNIDTLKNMTGLLSVAVTQDPTDPLQLATKQYVDAQLIANGALSGCALAATGNFSATYDNGVAGVGATLMATSTGPLVFDGGVALLGTRVVIPEQTSKLQNGLYVVTTEGDTGVQGVLTRATDFDSATNIVAGAYTYVQGGTFNGGKTFGIYPTNPITVGTDDIVFGSLYAGLGVTSSVGYLKTQWVDFISGDTLKGAVAATYYHTADATLALNSINVAASASLVTFTLPDTSSTPAPYVGRIEISWGNVGGWKVQGNTGDLIKIGNKFSDVSGFIASTDVGDGVTLKLIAPQIWEACGVQGNISLDGATTNNAINNTTPVETVTGNLTVTGNSYLKNGGFNPYSYSAGTVECVDTGIIGASTIFGSSMLGGILEFTNGPSRGQSSVIVGFTDATNIELMDAFTVAAGTSYVIHYGNTSFAAQALGFSNSLLVWGSPLWQDTQFFGNGIDIPLSAAQIVVGTVKFTTFDILDPAADRVITLRDVGGDGDIVAVPTAVTTNQLIYATSATRFDGLATANNGLLSTSAAGVPSFTTNFHNTANNLVLGTGAGSSSVLTDASLDNVLLGPSAGAALVAVSSVFIGRNAAQVSTTPSYTVGIGDFACSSISGNNHVGIGSSALLGGDVPAVVTGTDDVAVGLNAMANFTTASFDVAIGSGAFQSVTTATLSVGVGSSAGVSGTPLISGTQNTFVGAASGTNAAASTNRTAIGAAARATADNQIVLGNSSVTSGIIGAIATINSTFLKIGNAVSPSLSGAGNTVIGTGAGTTLTTGTNCTLLGDGANTSTAGAIERIGIGQGVTVSNNHQAVIGSALTSFVSGNQGQTSLGTLSLPWSSLALGASSTNAFRLFPGTFAAARVYTARDILADGDIMVSAAGFPNNVITESTTARTLALADQGAYIRSTSGSATAITVPTNASVAFPIGAQTDVIQGGAGQVSFVAAGGVTINSKLSNLKIVARYAAATLKKVDTDTWDLIGDLAA